MKNTHTFKRIGLGLLATALAAQTACALVTIDSVYVGDIGNPNDSTGYGGVNYGYSIGKYEVTLNQYTEFLNAVAKTDTYGLYNANMGSVVYGLGISRSGASGSYSYSVIGSGNRPVTYVGWYDSARFVNWLHNGQPVGLQASGTTETGAYTLTGNSGIITRNSGWTYSLPSENEWYKAAYYQPAAQGGDADGYWLYATAKNVIPNSRNGSLTDPNSANFYRDDGVANGFNGGFAINNSTATPTGNALTDVGAFSLADSFYGTFDQSGNVYEWTDAIAGSGSARGVRGGSWSDSEVNLRASVRGNSGPTGGSLLIGFRVAIVPEPSVAGLMGLGALLLFRKRK